MDQKIRVQGHTFKYDELSQMYECRGRIVYDDYNDEIAEPSLWKATMELAQRLLASGIKAHPQHSEKGWCEVQILEK
tara:strand:- start:3479 stop:3709 length:231 start_codon:yes stop_codon:yes gene_type:complete